MKASNWAPLTQITEFDGSVVVVYRLYDILGMLRKTHGTEAWRIQMTEHHVVGGESVPMMHMGKIYKRDNLGPLDART